MATREPIRNSTAPQRAALGSIFAGFRPGEPLPDRLEIVVLGSNTQPGNFVLRPGIDGAPLGVVTTPGKEAGLLVFPLASGFCIPLDTQCGQHTPDTDQISMIHLQP